MNVSSLPAFPGGLAVTTVPSEKSSALFTVTAAVMQARSINHIDMTGLVLSTTTHSTQLLE